MINKRLLQGMQSEKKYIFFTYLVQVLGLLFNIGMIFIFSYGLYGVIVGTGRMSVVILSLLGFILMRGVQLRLKEYFSYRISLSIKWNLRKALYEKLYQLGYGYTNHVSSSEVVQLAIEGIEQLDHYYGRFLPQFFYAVSAPIILFVFLAPLDMRIALLLLLFVPAIPIAIAMVTALAKRVVGSYWKSYMNLSDRFLDNMQGLNVLKAYDSDEIQNQKMNEEAEQFRKATMRVLGMQLNNITVMDIVAYTGAAIGSLAALYAFNSGRIGFPEALIFILLVAEYFLPLRQLGSFFHIAMNGVAASERLFELLDMPLDEGEHERLLEGAVDIAFSDVSFGYTRDKQVLNQLNLVFPSGEMTALVGKSGSGKSTIVSLIMGIYKDFSGTITFQEKPLPLDMDSLMRHVALVDYNAYLFCGTIRQNLLMGKPTATDDELYDALDKVLLKDFVENNGGLDRLLLERGQNLSGGQRQRLSLARALLKDAEVYLFDEATSSIDSESEQVILEVISKLKSLGKTVIFISHRLSSCKMADNIYLLEEGQVKENGTYQALIERQGDFYAMAEKQHILESYAKGEAQ